MAQRTINDSPISVDLERNTKLLVVTQGESSIKLTVEQITALKALNNCEIETHYSKVQPNNKFKLLKNFSILAECNETNSIILLRSDDKRKDMDVIIHYAELYKGNIARNRDMKDY